LFFFQFLKQKNNGLSNFAYACFTILFILIGLTTLASSMNLLVLRIATISAEEQVAERLEAAELAKQAVHLEGDVINPNIKKNYSNSENPEQCDNVSVCSCACMDNGFWRKRDGSKRQKRFFSFFHKSSPVKRLFIKNHLKKEVPSSPNLAQDDDINAIEMKPFSTLHTLDVNKNSKSFMSQLNQINYLSNKNSSIIVKNTINSN
jgi:hypothetical protein